jgi:hypothetical protein
MAWPVLSSMWLLESLSRAQVTAKRVMPGNRDNVHWRSLMPTFSRHAARQFHAASSGISSSFM